MSLTSEEPNADHESSNEHHFFIKEDAKDQRSDEEEEEDAESKDENENKPELAHANVFAALAALQTGQLTLSQVGEGWLYHCIQRGEHYLSHELLAFSIQLNSISRDCRSNESE